MATLNSPLREEKREGSCPWCDTLLGDMGKYYGACETHRNCITCGKLMHPAEIAYCLNTDLNGQSSSHPEFCGAIDPTHSRCLAIVTPQFSPTAPITVQQSDLDRLNLSRLLLDPVMEWNADTNQQDAMFKVCSYVHDMNIDELFLFLRRMEAITAQTSVLIKKDKKAAEQRAGERAAKAFEAAKKQVQAQKASLPTVVKKLSQREKAIQGLIKATGIPEVAAATIIDNQIAQNKLKLEGEKG